MVTNNQALPIAANVFRAHLSKTSQALISSTTFSPTLERFLAYPAGALRRHRFQLKSHSLRTLWLARSRGATCWLRNYIAQVHGTRLPITILFPMTG